MTEPIHFAFAKEVKGRLLHNESMANHVSWRAGGPARQAYVPVSLDDLAAFLRSLPADEAVCFVGLGSNLLVRDGGFDGTVVLMHNTRGAMRHEGRLVYAEAGVASPKVARYAALHGYEGAEFLAGIPGTIGGALAMNAGCYGVETWENVERVQVIRRDGELMDRVPTDFEIGYRHVLSHRGVLGMNEWFVGAWFSFPRGNVQRARLRIKELLSARVASQPLNLPNAGSVFRNPPGDYAARLVEACGLKGFAIGGVHVSEKHANFIVNPEGRGTAADIEALIAHVREVVRERFGVALHPEVRVVGQAHE
ncbi:MAG TPA: UDP-N-acetylmuramate dehydrogenase [Burkholderiales bacterium]